MSRSTVLAASSTVTPSSCDPAERAEANRRSSVTGKFRSLRILRMTVPTCPVAPTIPTLTVTPSPASLRLFACSLLGRGFSIMRPTTARLSTSFPGLPEEWDGLSRSMVADLRCRPR